MHERSALLIASSPPRRCTMGDDDTELQEELAKQCQLALR